MAVERHLEHRKVEHIDILVAVEVCEAAAGARVLVRAAVDAGAVVGEALVEEVEIVLRDGRVAVEVPAAVPVSR